MILRDQVEDVLHRRQRHQEPRPHGGRHGDQEMARR